MAEKREGGWGGELRGGGETEQGEARGRRHREERGGRTKGEGKRQSRERQERGGIEGKGGGEELRGRGRDRAGRGKREEASRGKIQLRREKGGGGEGGELR